MTTIGFPVGDQESIIVILSAVLHIGNIIFQQKKDVKGEASDVEDTECTYLKDILLPTVSVFPSPYLYYVSIPILLILLIWLPRFSRY